MKAPPSAWPEAVFDAPLLRGLDDAARAIVGAAGRLHVLEPGALLFDVGDRGDGFFVLVRGTVELRSQREGETVVARQVTPGESFGDEASLALPRRAAAVATTAGLVAEIPTALFRRGAGRSGATGVWERELRALRRAATRDLLGESGLGGGLGRDDLDRLLDAARHQVYPRGERIFEVGDLSAEAHLVADGLVALQRVEPGEDGDEVVAARAYLARGDVFGEDDPVGASRRVRAVAQGATRVVGFPGEVIRDVLARNPEVAERLRRRTAERLEAQQRVVGQAAMRSTRHAFHDLYRLQVARSLLVIDNETCVRCGHCAWSCTQVHGESRLVRRGETIVARLREAPEQEPRSLLMPTACQHCVDPVCMSDCPTGAIERGPDAEVFIKEALCTGCGNCAKACPWENIRLAPRSAPTRAEGVSADVAIKCDLCRDYDGPACVLACPTGSIFRVEPSREVADVAEALGCDVAVTRARARLQVAPFVLSVVGAVALGTTLWAVRHHAAGVWSPGRGVALGAGWVALVALLGLLAHALPKRLVRVWMRRRRAAGALDPSRARSLVRPFVSVHVGLGLVGLCAAIVHAGSRLPSGVAGSLYLTWLMLCGLGLWGALAYRLLPSALARIERAGDLPEDLPRHREALVDRLHRELSGRSALVKTVADRVLLPYARASWGALALVGTRRSLAQEQACVRARVEAMLQGRGADKLHGLDALVGTAVELRALPARRLLHGALRGWLLPHVMLTGIVVVLATVHVAAMGFGP